jgi:hypothetical protein
VAGRITGGEAVGSWDHVTRMSSSLLTCEPLRTDGLLHVLKSLHGDARRLDEPASLAPPWLHLGLLQHAVTELLEGSKV